MRRGTYSAGNSGSRSSPIANSIAISHALATDEKRSVLASRSSSRLAAEIRSGLACNQSHTWMSRAGFSSLEQRGDVVGKWSVELMRRVVGSPGIHRSTRASPRIPISSSTTCWCRPSDLSAPSAVRSAPAGGGARGTDGSSRCPGGSPRGRRSRRSRGRGPRAARARRGDCRSAAAMGMSRDIETATGWWPAPRTRRVWRLQDGGSPSGYAYTAPDAWVRTTTGACSSNVIVMRATSLRRRAETSHAHPVASLGEPQARARATVRRATRGRRESGGPGPPASPGRGRNDSPSRSPATRPRRRRHDRRSRGSPRVRDRVASQDR